MSQPVSNPTEPNDELMFFAFTREELAAAINGAQAIAEVEPDGKGGFMVHLSSQSLADSIISRLVQLNA